MLSHHRNDPPMREERGEPYGLDLEAPEPTTAEQIFGIVRFEDPLAAKRRRLHLAGSAYDAALLEYLDELAKRVGILEKGREDYLVSVGAQIGMHRRSADALEVANTTKRDSAQGATDGSK